MPDKLLERFLLDRFLVTLGLHDVGEIVPGEQPDFVIYKEPLCIGIEVTRYFIQSETGSHPLQEQESLRNSMLQLASEKYASRDHRLVHVNILFHFSKVLRKNDLDQLAEQIVHLVSSMDVPIGEFETIESSWKYPSRLPDQLLSITVARLGTLKQSSWLANDVGFMPECAVKEIQFILDSKESKVDDYRERCSEIWLLIAVDGFGLSSNADFPQNLQDAIYSSSFDRAFLFVNQESRYLELKNLE